MLLKWQQEKCECGLDLTTHSPIDEIVTKDEAGKVVVSGVCPGCGRVLPMIYVEEAPEVVAEVEAPSEAPVPAPEPPERGHKRETEPAVKE